MTARLILFTVFLALATWILSLSSYREYFKSGNDVDRQALEKKIVAHKAAQEAGAEGVAASAAGGGSEDKMAAMIAAAKVIYTGKGECLRCHGVNGQGNPAEEAPLIGGQHDWYVYDQLKLMKAGERVNEKMNPYLKDLTTDDMKALSVYIAQLSGDAMASDAATGDTVTGDTEAPE